jgi:oligoendopeptidase F
MANLMKQQQVQAMEREADLTRVIQNSQEAQRELLDRVEQAEDRRLRAMADQEQRRLEEQERLEEARTKERKRKEEIASIPSLPPMKHNTDLDDYTGICTAPTAL